MRDTNARHPRTLARIVTAAVMAAAATGPLGAQPVFDHVVIDATNPANPHCKTLADIDGDGLLDAVAASSAGGGMYWYEAPAWTQRTVRASGSWTTDMQAGDVDGDGDPDLVIPDGSGLRWYENPRPAGDPRTAPWTERTIGASGANNHDVELADVDGDGDLDVVTRKKGGGGTYFWRQGSGGGWTRVTISTASGEGIGLGDLDGDGDLDVAQNGHWVEQVSPTSWTTHPIDPGWPADDVGVVVADIDGDGALDVVLGPSESSGRLSWYEAVDPVAGPWIEHPIDPTVSYLHTFKAADMDGDGDPDLVTAEMHQSSNPDEVSIYWNESGGAGWTQQVVAEGGSHNLRVGDLGADGDLDIFGANWNDGAPNSAVIEAWENQSAPLPLTGWRRHLIETSLPWQAVFVDAKDLNGDRLPDLVTGGWWYPNPGVPAGAWTRQTIGAGLENFAVAHDFDNDGDLDLLGTDGQPGGEAFAWAENDGAGGFLVRDITSPATGGDFLQGVAIDRLTGGGREEVVLSWHNGGNGTAALSVPVDPTTAAWPLTVLSATTNQEAIPTGDLDGDGDADIHLGTSWLRREAGGGYTTQSGISLSGGGVPDRVVLGDLDGDGDLDVVVGVEFADNLVWGENDGAGGGWTEHAIASDFDYFSVDVRDLDLDGDLDVVGGAHMGSGEVSIYENLGPGPGGVGRSWATRIVDPGDSGSIDHHDGTRVIDIDLDRDLDIVSIGWSKKSLVVYENLAIDGGGGGGGGGDTTPPGIVGAWAWGPPTEVVVDFDEPVTAASAGAAGNYSISGGVTVSAAAPAGNGRAVTLTTSGLTPATAYTLAVANVIDTAGNPIAPGASVPLELAAADPSPGLVAYWPLDEGVGSVALDRSGNGRTGFLAGGAGWAPGPAAAFDGSDGRAEAAPFDVAASALTIAAWIRPDDLGNCSSHDCRIVSKATGTASEDHHWMLSTIASGSATRLRFRLKTGGSTTTLIATSGDLGEGVWRHAAAVYDGASMALYLDGAPVGSSAKSGAITGDAAVPVWIGGNPPSPSGKPWAGELDDVRIYDRALTPAELLALPPPSAAAIFTDGFESGDLASWGAQTGALAVVAAAARTGVRGARVEVGTACAGPDEVTVEPPPTAIDGPFEACRTLTVSDVEVVAPGAQLRAGERVALGHGFRASGDLVVEIDPALAPFSWLSDSSPAASARFTAEFDLRLDGLALAAGDRLEHLVGHAAAGVDPFRLILEPDGAGGHQAVLEAGRDDGGITSTPPGSEAPLGSGWKRLRLEWVAGAGSGRLALYVDGVLATELSGLANAARRLEAFGWGSVGGTLSGPRGTLDLDRFVAWE